MEGPLERKKTRLGFWAWEKHYAILRGSILLLLDKQGGEIQQKVHLMVAEFNLIAEETPDCFMLHTGSCKTILRAASPAEAARWLSVLAIFKQESTSTFDHKEALKSSLHGQPTTRDSPHLNLLLAGQGINDLSTMLQNICVLEARFGESATRFAGSDEARYLASQMRKQVVEAVRLIEEERSALMCASAILREKRSTNRKLGQPETPAPTLLRALLRESLPLPAEKAACGAEAGSVESAGLTPGQPRAEHDIITRLTTSNLVFRQIPPREEDERPRRKLPNLRNAKEQTSFWQLLRCNMGKDLTRVTLPITWNMPVSLVQKCAEGLEYESVLCRANNESNRFQRLALVLGFCLMPLSSNVFSQKKPFNSLLGETFELVTDRYRYVAEQVLHHPPVTAYFAESAAYEINGSFNVEVSISWQGLGFVLKGAQTVMLKSTGERFSLTRPNGSVHNYIFGNIYTWFDTDMVLTNTETGERAFVRFLPKAKRAELDYRVEGAVVDAQGVTQLLLRGKWSEYLEAVDPLTGEVAELARRPPDLAEFERQFFLTPMMVDVNRLAPSMLTKLPPTDARLRPDMRAYEHGQDEAAEGEKLRLEESQRARRKENESRRIHHRPKWFSVAEENGEMVAQFTRDYFKARELQQWPDMVDIFN